MIKTDIPDKLLNHQEETTIQLNNHELVRIIKLATILGDLTPLRYRIRRGREHF